ARSQTFLAPVMSKWLRNASSSVTRGSTFTLWTLPLMRRATGIGPGPRTRPPDANCAASAPLGRVATAPPATPAPRNEHRENPFLPGCPFLFRPSESILLIRHLPFRDVRSNRKPRIGYQYTTSPGGLKGGPSPRCQKVVEVWRNTPIRPLTVAGRGGQGSVHVFAQELVSLDRGGDSVEGLFLLLDPG